MRMFAQEILYRSLVKHHKLLNSGIKSNMKKVRMEPQDLISHSGLKYVFVTASPVLTNEVKSFYSNLKE